jgi:hypothetical protein
VAKPITDFLPDLESAQADTPARRARLAALAAAVDRARTDLADALAALSAAVNETAHLRRAGRLLRDLGYDVPAEPPPEPAAAQAPAAVEPDPEPARGGGRGRA